MVNAKGNVHRQEGKHHDTLVGRRTVALKSKFIRHGVMIFEHAIDEDHQTFNCMVCCGTNDPRTQYDMTTSVSVDQAVADLHGISCNILGQLVRALAVRSRNVWQNELVAAAAIHSLAERSKTIWHINCDIMDFETS